MIRLIATVSLAVMVSVLSVDAMADGPTETRGISANVTGIIRLDGVFSDSIGWVMRAREVTIAPGGHIAVHTHTNRPAIAYVLEGQVTEHRLSEGRKVVATPGTTMTEITGLTHWIENSGEGVARAIVVDIVPPK